MTLPGVIFSTDTYHSALARLAWIGAGWLTVESGGLFVSYGPASIRHTIDLDVLDLTGCLDARLPAAKDEAP